MFLEGLPDEIGKIGTLKSMILHKSNIVSLLPLFECTLACSRFRCRAAMPPVSMSLPLLLGNVRLVFRPYDSDTNQWIGLEEPHAIYCTLPHFRGYFVEAITRDQGIAKVGKYRID